MIRSEDVGRNAPGRKVPAKKSPRRQCLELARAHLQRRACDEAEAVLRSGLERRPDDLDLMTTLAQVAFRARNWSEAVSRCQAVLDTHGDAAPAKIYNIQAKALRALWADDDAEVVLRRGLDHHPGHLALMTSFAELACSGTQWKTAVSRYRVVLDTHGENSPPEVYGRLATAHQRVVELSAAEEVLEAGLDRFPDDPGLIDIFAEVAFRARDWAQSARRHEAILAARGDATPASVFLRLAQSRHMTGDGDGAHAALSRGLALYPDDLPLQTQCPWQETAPTHLTKTAKLHPLMRLTVDHTFALETECLARLGKDGAVQAHFPRLLSSNSRTGKIVIDFKGYSLQCLSCSNVRMDVPDLDRQVARIMRALKDNSLVHLDINAANIVVDRAGTLGLIDFGLSVLDESPINEPHAVNLERFKRAGGYPFQAQCIRDMVLSTCSTS